MYLNAQPTNRIDTLLRKFELYKLNNYQEIVHINTDRASYIAGENLWFSVFLTEYSTNQLSDLSKIVYVELLDYNNKPILQTKIKLNNGLGDGVFSLPTNLISNTYTLRAYSFWMRNFSSDLHFKKEITILNTFKSSAKVLKSDTNAISVNFFPESGNLIHNISSNLVCQIKKKGKPFSTNGFILSQKNDTLLRFKTNKFGFSKVLFIPNKNFNYKVLVMNERESINSNLPQILTDGYVLKVEDDLDNSLSLSIKSSQKDENLILFYHVRNQKYVAKNIPISNFEGTLKISKSDLIQGIVHFVLFSQNLDVLVERFYYNEKPKLSSIKLYLSKNNFKKREKITFKIENLSKNISNISMSVFAYDSLNINNKFNFDDLNRFNYDFKSQSNNLNLTKNEIDLFMICKNNNTLKWKELLNTSFKPKNFIPEIYDHVVMAQVFDSITGSLASNVECFLSFPSKYPQVFIAKSNENGTVFFETKNIDGFQDAIFQTYSPTGRRYLIKPISPFFDFSTETKKHLSNDVEYLSENQLTQRHINMQLNAVFYNSNIKNELINYDTTLFFGSPDEYHNLDNYERFKTFDEVLSEFVPGMGAKKRKGKYNFQILDRKNKGYLLEKPLVMLDGVPVFDEDSLMNFSPLKVKSISLTTNKYYTGKSTWGGIANFQTYKGDLAGFPISSKWLVSDFDGIQPKTIFKSVNESDVESKKPDFRNLLYWNSSIKLDKNQSFSNEFYTSDKPAIYKIELKGLDVEGNFLKEELFFEVK